MDNFFSLAKLPRPTPSYANFKSTINMLQRTMPTHTRLKMSSFAISPSSKSLEQQAYRLAVTQHRPAMGVANQPQAPFPRLVRKAKIG